MSLDHRHEGKAARKWQKLLWIRQDFPDNYTDEATFLDHLQRNPRLEPFRIGSLFAGLSVFVQHLASTVVFVCAFAAIFQGIVPADVVAGLGSVVTVFCWALYELFYSSAQNHKPRARRGSEASLPPTRSATHRRLVTFKSTTLLLFALVGLSPMLASLTKSTSSDSIWAMAFWLLLLNIIFFDYSAFSPSQITSTSSLSLSTNAALMGSAVLASRLDETRNVFLFILFSIQVFGIFPFFRRYVRAISWNGHLALTAALVSLAGIGLRLILAGPLQDWISALSWAVVSLTLTGAVMAVCVLWLVDLQQYKNEIHGPWDPAKPVIIRP